MSSGGQVLVGALMVIGLIGVLVPLLPGLMLIWGAGLWWTIADGGGASRWTAFGIITALGVAGTLAKYVLPARSATARGAPTATLVAGAAGAVIGFFVIPVIGAIIGGLAGLFLAEFARLSDARRALASTAAALLAIGVGVLVEFTAGVLMIATWAVAVLAT